MTDVAEAWFASQTAGAPELLRQRSEHFFLRASSADLTDRLARAGHAALADATRDGAGRGAALDLLAADALITLALLRVAEEDPARLGDAALRLRTQAAVAP